jgi:hypothetical protein
VLPLVAFVKQETPCQNRKQLVKIEVSKYAYCCYLRPSLQSHEFVVATNPSSHPHLCNVVGTTAHNKEFSLITVLCFFLLIKSRNEHANTYASGPHWVCTLVCLFPSQQQPYGVIGIKTSFSTRRFRLIRTSCVLAAMPPPSFVAW